MFEYGEAYLAANEAILADMKARMSPGAYALGIQMAEELLAEDAEEEDAALAER